MFERERNRVARFLPVYINSPIFVLLSFPLCGFSKLFSSSLSLVAGSTTLAIHIWIYLRPFPEGRRERKKKTRRKPGIIVNRYAKRPPSSIISQPLIVSPSSLLFARYFSVIFAKEGRKEREEKERDAEEKGGGGKKKGRDEKKEGKNEGRGRAACAMIDPKARSS